MKITVVIPNYNGEKLLEKNLPRVCKVLESTNEDIEIVIADDASTDASLDIIQTFVESKKTNIPINVVKNPRNNGFSSNVNSGVKVAQGEIILLLNTDVIPEEGFLSPLLAHFKDQSVFAVGCMDKSIEGNKIVLRGRGLGQWNRGLLIHTRGEVDKTNTLWVSCGSGAFRKSIWDRLRGLDPLYNPYYWEDIDLSYRAVKSGYTIVFEPKSIVLHEHEKGAILTKHKKERIMSTAYRNQMIFLWKNISDFELIVSHILWTPVHIGKAITSGNKTYLHGYIRAIMLLPSVLYSRNKVSKQFKRKDSEVIRTIK